MLDARTIFDRYEEIRPRLPRVPAQPETVHIASLRDITDKIDAFVFDAFGVLNVGERLIEGADRRLDELRARGCRIRILTNAASYDRAGAIAKFKRLGLSLHDGEIVTSREAALTRLPEGNLGVISAAGDRLVDITGHITVLGDVAAAYDIVDAFVFLSAADWTDARQELLLASMARRPRPLIVANADLAAPRETGFTLEPGHFGHLVADRFPDRVRFFGKPFRDVYDIVEGTLPGIDRNKIAMCGDTLHTDILGAAAFGWRTVLVTDDGLFAGLDAGAFCRRAGLFADWRVGRI
jgi:HAD superfamily hydrolase (TIGR01450 family)